MPTAKLNFADQIYQLFKLSQTTTIKYNDLATLFSSKYGDSTDLHLRLRDLAFIQFDRTGTHKFNETILFLVLELDDICQKCRAYCKLIHTHTPKDKFKQIYRDTHNIHSSKPLKLTDLKIPNIRLFHRLQSILNSSNKEIKLNQLIKIHNEKYPLFKSHVPTSQGISIRYRSHFMVIYTEYKPTGDHIIKCRDKIENGKGIFDVMQRDYYNKHILNIELINNKFYDNKLIHTSFHMTNAIINCHCRGGFIHIGGIQNIIRNISNINGDDINGNIGQNVPVKSTRIRVGRNIHGYGLSPGILKHDKFIESGPFMMSKRKLTYNYARSLCRSQYYDLATIYEEDEYKIAQSLCANNTLNKTNCYIGYEKGILNEDEWMWVQNIPISAIPINELVNTDLWSIFPWQLSTADIYCQATTNVTISYASNGQNYGTNVSEEFRINEAIKLKATNVLYDSTILFTVTTKKGALPGLKCSIHFEEDIYSTQENGYVYWNVDTYINNIPHDDSDPYEILEAYSTVDRDQTAPVTIADDAQWIWNYVYENKSYVTDYDSITFKFSFEHVKNVQNKPGDNCASISYYPPNKWKTDNCENEMYFICNAYDHKPIFKITEDNKFAVLTDRQLTYDQSAALCANVYGYGLAIVYSYYEYKQINDMLIDNNISSAWIGLYYDNETFINPLENGYNAHYGWETQNDFIFDAWTLNVFSFDDPPINGNCMQQNIYSSWETMNCNSTSYAICNVDIHTPNFTESELGSYYLLDQPQSYLNGEEMCSNWLGIRSKGAIIYHPLENERAIWLCSNATNGKGCYIGYNNINGKMSWRNGALIDVNKSPWFGNPWLYNDTLDTYNTTDDISDCTAIVQDINTGIWGWDIIDCDEELNILCDNGNDHSQCWMLQSCSECAIRSDCRWCGNQCQLNDEICYNNTLLVEQEFGCPDFNPIVNITYEKDMNYTYTVNITMCASTAPDDIDTDELINYVNESNCVIQHETIEFYILSNWEAAMYGNYDILGKVIELRQSSRNPSDQTFENVTTFEELTVCDIKIYHGWVTSITCDNKGAGQGNNITQFDMLHDILRYLLPRLQTRLFEGWDIPEESLFGYSTMERDYNYNDYDHSINRKFRKETILNERYANMTSDLLWEHQHTIESGQTNINHMNASMIHVFTHIPHQNESENIQLFTWAGYQLTLINKDPISTSIIQPLYDSLYSSITITKNYTLEEWRGIRPGNFMFKQEPNEEEIRRRLGFIEGVESFCKAYNKLISEGVGEVQFGIGGINIWASQLVNEIKAGASFLEILAGASGYEPPVADKSPLVIIPHFLELDLGFECSFGFGWDFKKKTEGVNIKDTNVEPSMKYCPLSFQIANDVLPNIISKEAKTIVMECCAVFHKAQQDCDKTLREAHEEANKCLKSKSFCSKVDKRPKSYLTGASIYEWNDGAAPELDTIIKFVLFFVDNGWKTIEEDIAKLFGAFLEDYTVDNDCATGKSSLIKKFVEQADKFLKTDDVKTLLNFARELGKIIERAKYIQIKDQHCTRKNGPLLFDLDITFHFGFVNPTLKDMCKIFGGFTEDNNDRRRRLKMLSTTYPIIPEIPLPCIPIYPPFIMLCPELSITTTFGLEIDPDIQDGKIGAVLAPDVSFDITASLGLTIGIWIIDCEIVLGVKISVIALSFPFEIGVNYADHFGLFGSISIDIKVLEFTIFLRFKICFHFFFFSTCPINVVLWQFSVTAYEYKKQLAQWGMGTNAAQSNLPANYNDAMSKIRFYWAFKDDEHKYNHEYDYGWEEDYFSDFTYEKWADDILGVSSCQIKYGTITKEWHIMSDDLGFVNITDPYLCKYNLEGFDKVLVTEVTIQWYSELGMKTCFDSKVKPMFKEKLCCNFALKVYDEIHKVTGIKFAISSYKMIVMDLEENWSNKCAQFFLNIEVQIDHAPYYDDCSDEGWKIAKGIKGEYHVGFHNIFGEDALYHYNGARTCLNWYNSTRATKTLRTFEILYPYDFLMIGMRFWAEAGVYHDPSNWYGIRIANATNYYWMNNMDANCDPTENAFSKWYDVGVDIENISDSRSYCYTDVLMYFDPMIDLTKKYRFDLEIIANVDSNEFWGFSSLVFNTFDNEDICVNNINPVIALTSTYSNIEYNYYGLKYIPSLYYGYVLFDISFDYRFHDISALISLSTDDSNTDAHWVINFDNQQSGIWIRSGTGLIPSDGILTLNSDLASIIVDTDNNDDIVYTKMYIQWDANEDTNFMRVGFGHILGQNIIASVDYDKFKFDTSTPIKYVGFARSLGSSIPDVKWKIYTNNLPTFCISQIEDEKIHKTHNYKQTCIEDETGTTDLIIYDLVTPDCIYYTTDLSNALQYTFTITQPHDYVLLNMKLFAEFTDVVTPHGQCEADDTVTVLFASDGDHFSEISSATLPGYATFNMDGISHLSKLRFVVKNLGNGPAWLSCTLSINGQDYITSDDENYWRIIKAEQNGKKIYTNVANSGESKRIWNTADANSGVYKVIFEFSFQNVYGSDYIEIDIEGQPNEDTKIIPKWDPNLDREVCTNKDYYDGISNHLSISCFGSLNATFEHLSQQEIFAIKFVPYGVTEYGISDIKLEYGLCRDVLPLIETNIRYNTEYMYWNADELYSISNNYLFGMVKCELDTYESASTYISIGTNNQTQPRFIVRLYENIIEIWTSVHDGGLFGETLIASNYTQMNAIINNKEWFEFYIEWDKNLGFFRIGNGYVLGVNVLLEIDFYELYSQPGIIIDTVGVMHTNPKNIHDFNIITLSFVPTNEPKLCWTSQLESVAEKSWVNTKIQDLWLTKDDTPMVRIPTKLTTSLIFNGPFVSGDTLSKTLTSIYSHDYMHLKAKIYGFGLWDVEYPTWMNGLSLFLNNTEKDSLLWFGSFLNNGGASHVKCDISEYKQLFSWSELQTLNGLPLDILTNNSCYYDIDLYIKHNATHDPFLLSFIGDLTQTKCDGTPQFDIQLDMSSDTTIDGYPIMLNETTNQNNYIYCHGLCNDVSECEAWMYNVSGYCWLKTTSDLYITRKGGYISGLCDGPYIFDENSTCLSGETLIQKGYKTNDLSEYISKHYITNAVDVSIICESDASITIATSMDNGINFEINELAPNVTTASSIDFVLSNLTYVSQIKFDVINNGYITTNNDMYYGFEHVDYPDYFIHHCGSNIYLNDFAQDANRIISDYQWQIIQPGLTGDDDTVSIKGKYINGNDTISSYITVDDYYDGINDLNRLTFPISMYDNELQPGVGVVCIAEGELNISFSMNGNVWPSVPMQYDLQLNGTDPVELDIPQVTSSSKLRFSILNAEEAPGLKCSIYSVYGIISTSNDTDYWNIIDAETGDAIIKTVDWPDSWQTPETIQNDAEWIWNYDCSLGNASNVSFCDSTKIVFELSFSNIQLYTYEMSTFKLTQCDTPGQEDAFAIQGVGLYSNEYFSFNDVLIPADSNVCVNEYQYMELNENNYTGYSCWYIRNANPGVACKIDIENMNATYVTNTDTTYWTSINIEMNDNYLDSKLNLTKYGGSWIWNQQCLPLHETDCINNDEATFTFSFSNILTYPKYDKCQQNCENNEECDGWIYKQPNATILEPICYLKADLPIDLVVDDNYVTGLNIQKNECDCICGDCYPGNEYHYIYIENDNQFRTPLYIGSTLYSHSCDFKVYLDGDNYVLENIDTGNILDTISISKLSNVVSNKTWTYPVRMILDGPILSLVDDDLENIHIYQKHCTVETYDSYEVLDSSIDLGQFYIPEEFSVQFVLEVTYHVSKGMKIMTLGNATKGETYLSFGWDDNNITYVELYNNVYTITDSGMKTLGKGKTDWTIKVSKSKLQIWSSGAKVGYQSFKLNNGTNSNTFTNIPSKVYTIAPWNFDTNTFANSLIKIQEICVSDDPFKKFKSNQGEFDYGMRCWSGKYKNINRKNEFISSFISDSGCASVTTDCSTSFGEDLEYITYFNILTEKDDYNDPACFVGKFADPDHPTRNNKLCYMFKKCESPSQSLYKKSWGFSGVNLTTSICQDIVPNITRKISIEWDDEFEINYGTLQIDSNSVYTINNNYLIFSLRPIRFPTEGFDNRSVYISFMNVNDTAYGQELSNLTWTFELNNEFGVKFYRGDRNVTERLIATQYVENILEGQDNTINGYCLADNDINISYAHDGENFIELTTNDYLENMVTFTLNDVSFVSKLRFSVKNDDDYGGGLVCSINVNGVIYTTSSDSAFWSISESSTGNTIIKERDTLSDWLILQKESEYISNDAKWIWNYECSSKNKSYCSNQSVVFDFSFYNVHNPDGSPTFYFEWDPDQNDYMRFGFYNYSNEGIAYNDNKNLILEAGYVSNFYSYDIYYDGYFGFHKKIYIEDVMFSIVNDSYNIDWFTYINIVNTTDPKPCFGYDLLKDKETRITTRDLETFSLWTDDGRSNWKLNGNTLPGWHSISYLNLTSNSTYNRDTFPYYFHYPFVSNQKSWQRAFSIDNNIDYDYIQIEFDIFTFCDWNHETDTISVALAFEEYLHFTTFWESTHTQYNCEGYNSQTWDNVIDIVRNNNDTHSDISCYIQGMQSPQYQCNLNIHTAEKDKKENIDVIVHCNSYGINSDITIQYSQNGISFDNEITNKTQPNHIGTKISDVTRYSKLQIGVNNNDKNSTLGGLKCSIIVGNTTYYSNTSNEYWSVVNSNNKVATRNSSDTLITEKPVWIWNNASNDTYVLFEFDFYNVFIKQYNLNYINTQQINISNNTNITSIIYESTPLTTCNLIITSNDETKADITITDGEYISSDTDSKLSPLINSDIIDYIYIDLEPYSYDCRIDIYNECDYTGDITRIDSVETNINIINNASSWKFYASRSKKCIATFFNSLTNETYTISTEDGGMVVKECNKLSSFDSINITSMEAHYGCYTHVRFEAPNTNSQPFVLRIESEIDDISTKFGTYKKTWGFGNLTITPLYCQSFSNIVPLKSPITLTNNSEPITFTNNELISINYDYLFILIDFENENYHIELYMLMGDSKYDNDYYWNITISETDCKLENLKLQTIDDCSDNINYMNLVHNITNSTLKPLIWISWDPYEINENSKNLSIGFGSELNENTIASLNIYGEELRELHSYIDYITLFGPKNDQMSMTLLPIQFDMPKICLSTLDEANKYDLGNIWYEDCNALGWELRKYAHIHDDNIYYDNKSSINQCQITNLNTNPITKISSDCFHGPFKGVEYNDYGDYISRYFYVFTNIDYDIIDISLNYYSLCTWNPEQFENDTAYVFINDQAIWKSAPQYEFVNEYCQGYSLYSDWSLYLDYENVLNNELIQCLDLLDQICEYPVNVNFRHKLEKDELYFSVGISAKLNQQIGNEAFGFGNVSITYSKCPILYPLPIGSITDQPLGDLNTVFNVGDMLDISSNSIYYLVADNSDDDSNSKRCVFYLFGGYTMWSQSSSNCTIAGLPIMANYPILDDDDDDNNGYKLGISDEGFLFLQDSNEKKIWSRRTACDIDTAYFYYSINKTNSLVNYATNIGNSLYSIDCKWALIITKQGKLKVYKNVTAASDSNDGVKGDSVWSRGNNVGSLVFDSNGTLILNDYNDGMSQLSPPGADYLIFDEGKLALIDYDTNTIFKQYNFEFAQCILDSSIGFIKYFYFMKPGDILWNDEALISKNCQYKLILINGTLMILNENNQQIWSPNTENRNAEKFEFLQNGDMVLYSYSSDNEIIWQTNTSTLLHQKSIFYADRAILYNDGQLFIIDNKTLTKRFTLFNNKSSINKIKSEYNYHLSCSSEKYDYIDKRYGFYATYISYYNCLNNQYVFNKTTPCIFYKYCSIVERYQNILLKGSGSQTNCRQYNSYYLQKLTNNYVLFQISFENTEILLLDPVLSIILTTSKYIKFGNEFNNNNNKYRTLLVTISPKTQMITLETKYYNETFYIPNLFGNYSQIEWIWIDWDINFDYISIGNSKYITQPIKKLKYSKFFKQEKLKRNEYLFDYFNFAWDTIDNRCYGKIIVQFPPLNVEIPKGCHDSFNYTEFPESIGPTIAPTITIETTESNNNENESNKNKGLSTASIIGIIIGCLIGVGIIITLFIIYQKRKRKNGLPGVLQEITLSNKHIIKQKSIANVDTVDVDYVRMEDDEDDQYL